MPLLTLADAKDFNDYKAELKTSTIKAKAQALPFRYVKEFQFNGGGSKKPMLLIGKLPSSLLADLKKEAATVKVKAQGLCRLIGESLEFEVEKGSMTEAESEKALKDAGISRETKIVDALSDGSAAKQKALDKADLIRRFAALNARLEKVRGTAPAPQVKVLDGLAARLKRHATGAEEEVDSTTTQELLDEFETKIVEIEHKDRNAASAQRAQDERQLGTGTAEDDAPRLKRLDDANKAVDAKTAQAKLPEPKPLAENPDYVSAMKTLEVATQMAVAAAAWHNKEIKTQQDAEANLPKAQALVDALQLKIDAVDLKIAALKTHITEQERIRASATKYTQGAANKANIEIEKDNKAIAKLESDIAKIKKDPAYVALKEIVAKANKHGSARHGAQTGIDLQARRAATGGTSPDQPDNPHGVSMPRADGGGAKLNSIKWNKVTVKWEDDPVLGKRKIVNKEEVLKQLADETHLAKTSKSSMFISHVLEKEAVERALAIANACPWTEWKDGDDWKPIETITIVLGKPKKLAGWGYAVARNVDAKKVLLDANAVIERFRNGAIDQDAMLKGLDTSFATADDGSVPLVKEVRVTLGLMGGSWSSITHFPSAGEAIGWSLTGKTVRKNAKAAVEVATEYRER